MDTDLDEKLGVIQAMETYGGSFVKALASCMRHADHFNLERIKAAFPDYWDQYKDMANKLKEKK